MPQGTSQSFSGGILARLARNAVQRSSTEDAEAQVAIIMICAAVECALNDIVALVCSWSTSASNPTCVLLGDVMDELDERHASMKLKIRMTNFVVNGSQTDFGKPPFQDYFELMKLRDALVHRRPDPLIPIHLTEGLAMRYRKTIEYLMSKDLYAHPEGALSHPRIEEVARGSAIAVWAFNTGCNVYVEFMRIFKPVMPFEDPLHFGFEPISLE